MKCRMGTAFLAALKEKLTIKGLSIYGSAICEAELLAQYLSESLSMTTLSVTEDDASKRNCFSWRAEDLLGNNTIRNGRTNNVHFHQDNAVLVARLFAENETVRLFNVAFLPQALSLTPSASYCFWLTSLSNDETLEKLGLPFSIWSWLQWSHLFSAFAKKQSLKKTMVAVHATDHCFLPALCVSLQESEAEDKVSFGTDFVCKNMNSIHSRILSDVDLFCLSNIVGLVSHVLLACTHLTFIHFCLRMGHVYLALVNATYVKATSSLRRLRLSLYTDKDDPLQVMNTTSAMNVKSFTRNMSVRELGLHVDFDCNHSDDEDDVTSATMQDHIDCLAHAIGISQNMRRLHFQEEHLSKTAALFPRLSEDVADNFNLVQIVSGVLDQNRP
ncbi:hypothetical protein MRX96_000435 [Rhipicephalus microplus]